MTEPLSQLEIDSPAHPERNAEILLESLFTDPTSGATSLVYHRNGYREWTRDRWGTVANKTLDSRLYASLKNAIWYNADGDPMGWACTTGNLNNTSNAIQMETLVDERVDLPTWINGRRVVEPNIDPPMPANEMISLQNGLLHAPTRRFFGHTPQFFNNVSVPFNYDPAAGSPNRWLQFLEETWPDDQDSIDTLQEIFGYLLTSRTDLHKMFMIIGPPRTGKSTISNVLTELLGGRDSVTSTNMKELNGDHALENMRNKQLALMGDLRFYGSDVGMAVSRLLNITGEDEVSINPKNRDIYTARLSVRFMIVSNELPSLRDESGAIKSRLVLLKTLEKVPDWKIDSSLIGALSAELPAIFNWALDGLDRLNVRGQFQQPKSGMEDLQTMAEMSSPMSSFAEEYLKFGMDEVVAVDDLYRVYSTWCQDSGHRRAARNKFLGMLKSIPEATRTVKKKMRDPVTGRRYNAYTGVGLSEAGHDLIGQSNFLAGL